MAEALKHFYGPALARGMAESLAAIYPAFPKDEFLAEVLAQLDALELKDRVRLLAKALQQALPDDYPQALAILMGILGEENPTSEDIFSQSYHVWVLAQFVESYGLAHWAESMQAMYEITKRSTAEFAIRPFLNRYPDETLARLGEWVHDPNLHVRRLVSEGTRPRLPWAGQLRQFIADPTPTLALLEKLKDDEADYVRRSVANHLNDIAKDHPDRVLDVLEGWRVGASPERLWIIRHALRNLVKAGNPRALAILGYDKQAEIVLSNLSLKSEALHLGETLQFQFTLTNPSDKAQNLVVDYAIEFVKANGSRQPKVFKLKNLLLGAGESLTLSKNHALKPISTRVYYAGRHGLRIQVNGQVLGSAEFEFSV